MTLPASGWPQNVAAITLFAENLDETKAFYQQVFRLAPVFEDTHSTAFKVGTPLINLLPLSQAGELTAPAQVAGRSGCSRCVSTLAVDDVDATCAELAARGLRLLNGPLGRPWGVHTASFADPAGHIWETAR